MPQSARRGEKKIVGQTKARCRAVGNKELLRRWGSRARAHTPGPRPPSPATNQEGDIPSLLLSPPTTTGNKMSAGGDSQHEWDGSVPFRRVTSLMQVFSALPTLPLHEWTCRYLLLVCLRHGLDTNKIELLLSAAGAAYATRALAKLAAKNEDVRFPAQATVMIRPRESLHELELLTVALYVAALAARRHGGVTRGALGEAALAGLLTHLFCAPADANAPRFLWWTWHESHPSVKARTLNFPVSQALTELSVGAAFSLVAGWFLECFSRTRVSGEDALTKVVEEIAPWLPDQNRPLARGAAAAADWIRDKLRETPAIARISFVTLIVPIVHGLVYGGSQMVALDKVGSPSVRSYKTLVAALALWASSSQLQTTPVTIADSRAGARLAASVVAYFAVQSVIPFIGEPEKHVSTGVHQTFGKEGVRRRDAFGNKYEQNLSRAKHQYFTIEGSTRAALMKELEEKREALDDLALFLKAADKRVGDTELALRETQEWTKQVQNKVPLLREESEFVRDLEASNSVRLARVKTHLESRLEKAKNERSKLVLFENRLRAKVARLEDILEVGSIDPAGNAIIPASPIGPGSVWYTIRGVAPGSSRKLEEHIGIGLLGLLGMTAFTRALAYAA